MEFLSKTATLKKGFCCGVIVPGLLDGGEPLLHVACALRQEHVLRAVVEDDRESVLRIRREALLLGVFIFAPSLCFTNTNHCTHLLCVTGL